jgi:hypothetical protein
MPIAPEQFHEIATQLWTGVTPPKSGEPCSRTVAGRSYYAAYLATRGAARTAYNDPHFDVSHGPLKKFLIEMSGDPHLQAAGHLLQSLCFRREMADYHPEVTLTRDDAEFCLDEAGDLLARISTIQRQLKACQRRIPAAPKQP